MARHPTHRNPCRNPPPTGKDEPAGSAPTEGSNTYTSAPAMSRALIPILPAAPASAPVFAPAVVNSTIRYSKADLQRIFRTVLETKSYAPASSQLFFQTVLAKDLWRLGSQSCIAVRPTWSVITLFSNVKTISLPSEPKDQNACFLQPFSFKNEPCSVGSNTRPKTQVRLTSHSPGKSLKYFFVGAWENLELLLIASRRQLKETPSTNKKKS